MTSSDFSALLPSVRADLLEIDRKLEALQTERQDLERLVTFLARRVRAGRPGPEPLGKPGEFEGLSIAEAAIRYLQEVGQPERDTRELVKGMTARGWKTGAKKVYSTVFGTLNRVAQRENSDLVKKGSKWGLRQWYQLSLLPEGGREHR